MKVISYSLFKGGDPLAELFYVRGLYFNVLMNSIVYPGWQTVVLYDEAYATKEMKMYFSWLNDKYGVIFNGRKKETHCKAMLWRLEPIFWPEVEYVICRDADALTSLREANAVKSWIESDLFLHGINDNPAHSIPLLGGMCGFKAKPVRHLFGSWDNMLSKSLHPIDKHGSDQVFLNSVLYHAFPGQLAMALGNNGRNNIFKVSKEWLLSSDRKNPLWTSDLCTSFIGSAGCNEMETLRFFRDHLPDWGSDKELWEKYPKLFYWA